jgi:hypothetical protein
MAQVLAQFTDVLTDDDRVSYRAHAVGAEMPDGKWQGWLEFLPLNGAAPIRSARETTQPNRTDVVYWATGLTTVYLQGALQRALHPLVRSTVEPQVPAFSEPAPALAQSSATRGGKQDAVLNPFLVYERGEGPLRRQLGALSAWHLVNIIGAYDLSDTPTAVLNHLPAAQLIDIVVAAVANEHDAAR